MEKSYLRCMNTIAINHLENINQNNQHQWYINNINVYIIYILLIILFSNVNIKDYNNKTDNEIIK